MRRKALTDDWQRPAVMGIVNVTPDSFSDGGAYASPADAAATARRMLADGAALVDVGGESTRPGAADVSEDEELRRVVPVLERLQGCAVSIDTSRAGVARRAIALGATMVTDTIAEYFEDRTLYAGLTYNSHPVGCAAGVACINVYKEDRLIENAKALGEILKV